MKKVLIIGCGGAGKSTLARKLGNKTGLPVVHLDKLFWHPGWVESSREEIDARIRTAMAEEAWIIDGNYNRTIPERLECCDTVIYLDYPRIVCLWGVLKRVVTNYGRTRPDMQENCPERFDWEFLTWIWNFNKKNRVRYHRMLAELEGKQVFILKSRREAEKLLERL